MRAAERIVIIGGILGRAGNSTPAPTAPVLALISVTGNAAAFSIDVDSTVVAGDTATLQTQVTGGDWSSLVTNTTHTITAPEDAANEIDLTPAGFAASTYDARSKVNHIIDSAWSNIVSFTVTSSYTPTYFILGF